MAFAEASGPFTFNHSTFIDNSNINKNTSSNEKKLNGKGLQILLNASSTEASFDSQARHPPPLCHPSTRTGLLDHIFQWIDAGEENILFLDGPAGAGKSAVAQTVAESSAEKKILAATYFFFRGSPSRNTIAPLVPTLAYEMGTTTLSARKRKKLEKAIKDDPSILHKSSEVQLRKLILELYQPSLFTWKPTTNQKRYLLIIDGLDECNGEKDQRRILGMLGQLVKNEYLTLRCLITSRPEPHIISAVTSLPTKVARVTLNGQSWDANGDIRTYLRSGFDEISSRMSMPQPWPSDAIVDMLVKKAGGIFVYASTVLKYIGDQGSSPMTQLKHVLKLSPGTTPFAELDQLYHQILMACPSQHRPTLLHILGFTFLRNAAFEGDFDISIIEALLGLSPYEVTMVLGGMHSILVIRASGTKRTISFLHASFGDFIFNQERSGPFFIDRLKENLFLAGKCIDYMHRREERGLDSQIKLMGSVQIIYVWKSWFYHGAKAGDSGVIDVVEKLCHYDKTLWAEAFPDDYHHLCMDGLDAGIAWLQSGCGESYIDLVSELTAVRQTLIQNHTKSVLANSEAPLFVLRVFEDPGIEFFKLSEHQLVILERDDNTSEVLYFKCHGNLYNFVDPHAGLLVGRETPSRHGSIAIHCIHILKDTKYWPVACSRYAARYWTKHLSLSDIDDNVLEELWQIRLWETPPERWITQSPADALLIIRWLARVPHSNLNHLPELSLLWNDNLRRLEYNLNPGPNWKPYAYEEGGRAKRGYEPKARRSSSIEAVLEYELNSDSNQRQFVYEKEVGLLEGGRAEHGYNPMTGRPDIETALSQIGMQDECQADEASLVPQYSGGLVRRVSDCGFEPRTRRPDIGAILKYELSSGPPVYEEEAGLLEEGSSAGHHYAGRTPSRRGKSRTPILWGAMQDECQADEASPVPGYPGGLVRRVSDCGSEPRTRRPDPGAILKYELSSGPPVYEEVGLLEEGSSAGHHYAGRTPSRRGKSRTPILWGAMQDECQADEASPVPGYPGGLVRRVSDCGFEPRTRRPDIGAILKYELSSGPPVYEEGVGLLEEGSVAVGRGRLGSRGPVVTPWGPFPM